MPANETEPINQSIFPFNAIETQSVLDELNFSKNSSANDLCESEIDLLLAQNPEIHFVVEDAMAYFNRPEDPELQSHLHNQFLWGNIVTYRLIRQKLESSGQSMPQFSLDYIIEHAKRFDEILRSSASYVGQEEIHLLERNREVLAFEKAEEVLANLTANAMEIEQGELRESSPGYMGMVFQYHLLKEGLRRSDTKRRSSSPIPWLTSEEFRREAVFNKHLAIIEKLDGFFSSGTHARYPLVSLGRKVDLTDASINASAKNRNVLALYIDGYSGENTNLSLQTFPVLDEKSTSYLLKKTPEEILPTKKRQRDTNGDQRLVKRISEGDLPLVLAVLDLDKGQEAMQLFHSPSIKPRDAINFIQTGVISSRQGNVEVVRYENGQLN